MQFSTLGIYICSIMFNLHTLKYENLIIMQKERHRFHITQHSFKCFLKACLAFNNGLFNIFSGPLFANVEGYVYLDLMIWGLSPLTFMFLRPQITQYFKEGGHHIKGTTYRVFILIASIITVSYFFLNYSPLFNWNYFSRTFNLDMGYFVFDMMLRTFDLLIDLEDEKVKQKQCEAYCEIQHTGLTLAYGIVFFLSSTFQVNQRNNGPIIFAISTVFSFFSVILLPLIYYCEHKVSIKESEYHEVPEVIHSEEVPGHWQQQISSQKSQDQIAQNEINTSTIGYFLIYTSLLFNMNYFSLWMMEPLGTDTESSYQQYNITIQMVSGFFLISSFGNYIGARMFVFFDKAKIMSKIFLLIYGALIAFIYMNYDVNYVSVLVIGFGFHSVCSIQLASILSNKYALNFNFFLYPQIFAYFILPLICALINVGQSNLSPYSLMSGSFLMIGAILL